MAVLGNGVPKLGWEYLEFRPSGVALNLVEGSKNVSKWMSFGVLSACRGIRSLEEKSSKPDNEFQQVSDQGEHNISKRSNKDLSSFPSVLSYCYFSNIMNDLNSSRVIIALQF